MGNAFGWYRPIYLCNDFCRAQAMRITTDADCEAHRVRLQIDLGTSAAQSLYTAVTRHNGVNLHPDGGAGAIESCEKKERILPGTTPQNRAKGEFVPR